MRTEWFSARDKKKTKNGTPFADKESGSAGGRPILTRFSDNYLAKTEGKICKTNHETPTNRSGTNAR